MNDHAAAIMARVVDACTLATHRIITPLVAIASAIFLTTLLLPPPALAATGVLCTALGNESVRPDKLHYLPNETVAITGNGFAASCDVDVDIKLPDGAVSAVVVTTDASGNFAYNYPLADMVGQYSADLYGAEDVQLTGIVFTNGPVVMLDKGDVRSEETVTISGAGYTPLSELIVQIIRPDDSVVKSDGTPGSDTVTADIGGHFAYGYVVRNGVMADYLVDILDQSGTSLADTTFTDSGAFVQNLGTAVDTGNVTSLALTFASGVNVTPGNSIIIGFSGSNLSTPVACTDTASPSNTYTMDVTQVNGSGGSVSIISAHNVRALAGTKTITCTMPGGGSGRAMSANEFSGLSASPLDKTKSGTANNTSPSSGGGTCGSDAVPAVTCFTATTSQADEILFGAAWFNGTNFASFTTPGSGVCTGVPTGSYTFTNTPIGNGAAGSVHLATEYRIATATGMYAACGTLDTGNQWAAAIATYKIAAAVVPATLTVIKHVVNDNGGSASASAWTLAVDSNNGGSGTGSAAGSEAGTSYTLQPGKQYSVSESGGQSGYTASNAGDCTIASAAAGTSYTCTITNDDVAPTLKVIKVVNNTHGGTKTAADFNLHVKSSGVDVAGSPAAGSGTGTTYTLSAGTYVVSEDAVAGYTGAITGSCNGAGSVTLAPGDTATCTITNSDAAATLKVIKTVNNTHGGTKTAADFNLHVKSSGVDVTGSPAAGSGTGTTYTLSAGTYVVSEDAVAGYTGAITGSCNGAGSVTLAPGDTATCTITNSDVAPTLKVIKVVNNTHGGTKTAADFNLHVKSSGVDVTGSPAAGSGTGTTYTLSAGTYVVSEDAVAGYTGAITGSCNGAGSVTLAPGDTATCTITNSDVAPTLKVIKVVNNTHGGTKTAANFNLHVKSGGVDVTGSPAAGSGTGTTYTLSAGTYVVSEDAVAGYTGAITGSCNGAGNVTLAPGDTATCTVTNSDQAATLIVIKHVINDNGGIKTAADFSMTVTGTNVQPSATFAGAESPGTTVTLNAGSYSVDEAADAGYAGSIGANCSGPIANGETKTCTITNNDVAVAATCSFIGFYQPVDSFPTFNSLKAGQAVPVKFSCGGNLGLNIFALGYPRSVAIACDSTGTPDAVEETVTAGASSLQYDAATGRYIYVWKTDKAWANTCRQLVLKFIDGSEQRANFNLK